MITEKLPICIEIPQGFLEEEKRCGYLVTKKMKCVWAVELDLLKRLEHVCKKYNIAYFADSGTLLGAIRHQGYIPWDDDIDVVMFRNDYEKLRGVADKEFKYPYFFQTVFSDHMYIRGHAQLRNGNTTGCTQEDSSKPFNKGIFIDIFVLDFLPDDEITREKHISNIKLMWKFIKHISYSRKDEQSIKARIIGPFLRHVFFKFVDYKSFFKKYEDLCAKYKDSSYHTTSYVEYSLGKEKHMFRKEWYSEGVVVPFEFTSIVIPKGYDERLKKEYGDYMTIRKIPTTHGGLILDPNTPYEQYFGMIQ